MTNKLMLTIIVSIILTVIVVSLVNVGMSLIKEQPQYDDYCDFRTQEIVETQVRCEELGGEWNPDGKTYPRLPEGSEIQGYCDLYALCQEEYNDALKSHNQARYYVFAGLGFILLIVGLFAPELMIQLTGLAAGGILVTEGIVINLENKLVVFISLLLILAIFGLVAYRIINRKEKQ